MKGGVVTNLIAVITVNINRKLDVSFQGQYYARMQSGIFSMIVFEISF